MLRLGILNLYCYSSTYPAYPIQDRTYLVSEKLARGKASSAKHSGTPVCTDTVRERNTSPEPQQLDMLCGMGWGWLPPLCTLQLAMPGTRQARQPQGFALMDRVI